MSYEINDFLDMMCEACRDNTEMRHYAEYPNGVKRSTMPTTSFIYNFFIYNSIYQYDWEVSLMKGRLTPWNAEQETARPLKTEKSGESISEPAKQKGLEKFMRKKCAKKPELLGIAFRPLGRLSDLDGPWPMAFSDGRIPASSSAKFFKSLSDLARIVRSAMETRERIIEASKSNFELIQKCRFYIYMVRNDIFYCSESPGDIMDKNRMRRLAQYDLFLKCVLSLFFLCNNRAPLPS